MKECVHFDNDFDKAGTALLLLKRRIKLPEWDFYWYALFIERGSDEQRMLINRGYKIFSLSHNRVAVYVQQITNGERSPADISNKEFTSRTDWIIF